MRAALLTAAFLLLSTAAAPADVVYLNNGRRIEGEVVEETEDAVHVELESGRMVLPRRLVRRVEERMSAEEEYGLRTARIDMTDPEALEELALWASRRGLSERSRHLVETAMGIRLQAKVDAAADADDFVAVFFWARNVGFDEGTLRYLLGRARRLPSDGTGVRAATAALARDRRHREESAARRAEIAARPRYKMPEQLRSGRPALIADRARRAAARGGPGGPSGQVVVSPAGGR